MCKFCADVRDSLLTDSPASTSAARRDVCDVPPPPPPASSSASQLEERVHTLETLVENLHQSLSSSAQVENRVRTLETLVENLQQALGSSSSSPFEKRVQWLATLVRSLEQKLVQALQRVATLETTVKIWQQWYEHSHNSWQQYTEKWQR